jgi:type 2 lantibiotic biosynthesis protein LanM
VPRRSPVPISPTIPTTPVAGTLRRIIARAASPAERTAFRGFSPDASAGESRWAADWATAAAGSMESFRTLLAFRGLPYERWLRSLDDVTVDARRGPLPPWADDLRTLLSAPPNHSPVPALAVADVVSAATAHELGLAPDDPWPLYATFEPFLRHASGHLASHLDRSATPVAPEVARQLLAQLAQRWSTVAMPFLAYRLRPGDLLTGMPGTVGQPLRATFFGDDRPPRDQWLAALDAFPVLGRLLAVTYRFWLDAAGELLARLNRDRPRLQHALGASLDVLTHVRADAGDMHDRGRSVAILTFASGTRVVYKPKDLRIAAWYDELVALLHDARLSPRLHRRVVVHGDGYAWEQFVAAEPCASEAAVRRFYRRMGMHVRLVQLLDGVDFTTDNVIAHGEFPALIDLEMLVSPRLPPSAPPTATDLAVLHRVWDSPCRSGLITAKIIGDAGRHPAEVGALAAGDTRVSPFKQRILRRTDDGQPTIAHDYAPFTPSAAAPIHGGVPARADQHFADVARGYHAMHRCLWRIKDRLLAPGGLLDQLTDIRVRFLCRDTHIYSRLLLESWHPSRLRDGVAREICLERLWRGRFADPGVVQQEVDAVRDLDVPLFTARAGHDALLASDDRELPAFFDGNPLARARQRLIALPPSPTARDRDALDAVLFTLAPHARRPPRPRRHTLGAPAPLAVATAIGDALLRNSVSANDGHLAWHGLNYHCASDSWDLSLLGDDVLTGTGGLAIVFAGLARATGRRRFTHAARTLARQLARRLDEPLATSAGGMVGWGAWLYARLRVASALGDWDGIEPLLARIAATTPPDELRQVAGSDPITGLAGVVHVLLRATRAPGGHMLAPHACHAGHALLERRDPVTGLFPAMVAPADATTLATLPDSQLGATLALRRLSRRRLMPRFELSPLEQRSLDCLLRNRQRAAVRWLRALQPEHASALDLVAAIDVALAARAPGRAATLARALARRHGDSRPWFYDGYAADRFLPSATLGTAAIAHALLRAHDSSIASIRLLS